MSRPRLTAALSLRRERAITALLALLLAWSAAAQTPVPLVPKLQRSNIGSERSGTHDAANLRTVFHNFGMVGDFPTDPQTVDLSVFHSVEVPKGTGMNYSDGITPFVLAKIKLDNLGDTTFKDTTAYLMETGFRERQTESPYTERIMRFEPRPGYFEPNSRSVAISSDPRTWPSSWPDKQNDPDDKGWPGSWDGYFGKRPAADQESYTVMDDDFYDALKPRWFADKRDTTRGGLGLRIGVRGFQWSNPQAGNVIFWHYDITNEGTTDYDDNIVFGLYMDSGVGGSLLSCDGIFESDDDNAAFDTKSGLNLVYTYDNYGHGRDLRGNCSPTGYLGYAYLETPGNPFNGIDDDNDGIKDEQRDGGPGDLITGRQAILDYLVAHYDTAKFVATYGPIEKRPAFRVGQWWTGDEDMDWVAEFNDVGADGVKDTHDTGEGDGVPTSGEPNFDKTDLNESDQIGLTGFKYNKIKAGQGNPNGDTDGVLFYTDTQQWPRHLYRKFVEPDSAGLRFDPPLADNYNIAFLFASGPFQLKIGKTERFSLALAYGGDLDELRSTIHTVQQIYNANYQFAVPPTRPTVTAEAGDHSVRLTWDDVAERSVDPVTSEVDFEGYRIYRATDPDFRDARVITNGSGSNVIGNGRPLAQFDLVDGKKGFTRKTVDGVAYNLGTDSGIQHTFVDNDVTNGQDYYYAVCAYDFGFDPGVNLDSLAFYPSENSYSISRTLRGGTIFPTNVVLVRPNPRVTGFQRAAAGSAVHIAGRGVGSVKLQVVNSTQVRPEHRYKIRFTGTDSTVVRASAYSLIDSTTDSLLFKTGNDFTASGRGPVGDGILPIDSTLSITIVDTTGSKFDDGKLTNARLTAGYTSGGYPVELRRPGFPETIVIRFASTIVDTGKFIDRFRQAAPAKFHVFAATDTGETRLDFFFRDIDRDGTLSTNNDFIEVLTHPSADTLDARAFTWRVQLNDSGPLGGGPLVPPGDRDVWRMKIKVPFEAGDEFAYTTRAETAPVPSGTTSHPYVVPNPYLGAASFEPAPFNIKGRGERRVEFRDLARDATVRIYTVHGDLVQTLRQDGSMNGYLAWNLRTKDNLDLAPGLYIYHVETPGQDPFIGKFAVVK